MSAIGLTHEPGHLIDIMATCVDVGGAKYPTEFHGQPIQPLEGRSLVPAFTGQPIQREALFGIGSKQLPEFPSGSLPSAGRVREG